MGKDLYLVPHDTLVDIAEATTNWLNTPSWAKGQYSSANPSLEILEALADYRLTYATKYLQLLRREFHVGIYSANTIARRQAEQPDKYLTWLTTDVVTGNLHGQVAALELKPDALEG